MREIKFRGKRTIDGIWVYGYFWKAPDSTNYIREIKNNSTDHLVFPFSVGQFTGLKDKNGKEVYEGDLVKWETKELDHESLDYVPITKISKIVWSDRGFWVDGESFGWEGEGLWDWDEIEVIGNKYETPELIEL